MFAMALWGALVVLSLVASTVQPALAAGDVVVLKVDGTITPIMAQYVSRGLNVASDRNASAVVIEMDTPGGLASAMDDIVRDILESPVPVVVFVSPRGARAASAGVFITYAAHVAAMAPGTNIGSASPVFIGSGDEANDATLRRKITNDAVAQVRNLADLRGRNADWAESAVRDAVNITAAEALAQKVIDLTAESLPELLAAIDGRTVTVNNEARVLETAGADVDRVGMGLFEQLMQLLADPTIAYILLSIGMLGLFLELSSPGAVLPGLLGGLGLILGLLGLGTLPVNWTGALLIAFAFVLFIADIFLPSAGLLTVGGLFSFVTGSYLLISDEAPSMFRISPFAIWTMAACLVAFFLFLAASVLKARLSPARTGIDALVGTTGRVITDLAPNGMVMTYGERWDATIDPQEPPAKAGDTVVVTAIDGLHMSVRPLWEGEKIVEPAIDRRAVVPVRGNSPRRSRPFGKRT